MKYIGSTIREFDVRKKEHYEANDGVKFHNALKSDVFEWTILAEKEVENDTDLKPLEKWFISEYDTKHNGYNSTAL